MNSATPRQRLIIFTRYPAPGFTKTRLIPALGPVGAAELHQRLIQQTLAQADRLYHERKTEVEIRFCGGTREQMAALFGGHRRYIEQGPGDLGERLSRSVQDAFTSEFTTVAVIGTDCPDIHASHLAEAFEHLATIDVVLGPATDGGYYLIALSAPNGALFNQIPWSTPQVLSATVAIAGRLGLKVHLLPPLRDIDRPEDLLPPQTTLDDSNQGPGTK